MRLVSLSPSLTEIVESLGAGELLVGVTNHCPVGGGQRCFVGSPKALNLKAIDALKPDVVLADRGENRPEELKQLDSLNVVTAQVFSIADVLDVIYSLGRLVEKGDKAQLLSERIRTEVEENTKAVAEYGRIRTLVLLWNRPYITVNFDTYISRLVEASGGINVFHEDPLREFPVDLEDMIEKQPQLVLLAGAPFAFKKRHIAGFRKYRVFSKVRIEWIDGLLLSRFGPRTPDALRTLRNIILNLS